MSISFPHKELPTILSFLASNSDLNSASLVCKSWYDADRSSRRRVFIGNCYAVSPAALTRRFLDVRALELKGKPHFADFNLVPEGWGGHLSPWIAAIWTAYPALEELRLKRMVVTDDDLEVVADSFPGFKKLVLDSCEGFSTDGLAYIAANCRNLEELDLGESDVLDLSGDWLSHFPEDYTSLVSLNIACLSSKVSFDVLESLVCRCRNLKSLRLNQAVPLDKLANLLHCAPQLVEFGTGVFSAEPHAHVLSDLSTAFSGCKQLNRLSGLWDVAPSYLPALHPICAGLTALNLSYAAIQSSDLIKIIIECPKLLRLWVLDLIEDSGLQALAASCKDLQELRVFPSDPFTDEAEVNLTERGLVSVSEGCPKLNTVLYFCRQMTNNALVTIATNCPDMVRFRLCIIEPHTPDYLTLQPLDAGFGAIVQHCTKLRRLSLSGLLTDSVFEYIGTYAKKLEMLSVAFAGHSDMGLHHVLSGCERLKKLEIRDSPFGDKALLDNAAKLETMRSLWMSSCLVSFEACKALSQKLPKLNVEIIDERDSLEANSHVEKLYIYRSVAGPRSDMDIPGFARCYGSGIVHGDQS